MIKKLRLKISFILPVYNAEKSIERCIDSILSQSVQNFEIIVIDDGSTDATQTILKKKYSNCAQIKIFTQKNLGVSEARNVGIEKSSGAWIMFIDSDDWIEPNALGIIDRYLLHYPSTDFLVGDKIGHGTFFVSKYQRGEIKDKYPLIEGIIDVEHSRNKYQKNFHTFRNVTGQLYNAETIKTNKLHFPRGIRVLEDGIFNLYYLQFCKKIIFYEPSFYHYVNNSESATHLVNSNQLEHSCLVVETIKNYLKTYDLPMCNLCYLIINNYRNIFNNLTKISSIPSHCVIEKIKIFDKEYGPYLSGQISLPFLSLKSRVILLLIRHRLFNILYMLFKLKNQKFRCSPKRH